MTRKEKEGCLRSKIKGNNPSQKLGRSSDDQEFESPSLDIYERCKSSYLTFLR